MPIGKATERHDVHFQRNRLVKPRGTLKLLRSPLIIEQCPDLLHIKIEKPCETQR